MLSKLILRYFYRSLKSSVVPVSYIYRISLLSAISAGVKGDRLGSKSFLRGALNTVTSGRNCGDVTGESATANQQLRTHHGGSDAGSGARLGS